MSEVRSNAAEVLAARARELARPADAGPDRMGEGAEATSLLVARIADERVGIALDQIIEISRAAELTPIPGARAPVVGAMAWRGRVLTVLDIAPARRGSITFSEATRVVVLGERRAAFGIVADEAEDVAVVHVQDIVPLADIPQARRGLVRGVTADALVVLDAAALIAQFAPTH